MDRLHQALKWVDHNRFWAAFILVLVGVIGYAGCAVKTAALEDPTVMVTAPVYAQQAAQIRARLEAEAITLNKRIEAFNEQEAIGYDDLRAKQEQKDRLLTIGVESLRGAAQSAGIPAPFADAALGVVSALSVTGIVLTKLDNRRKDKVMNSSPKTGGGKTVQT